MRKFLYAALPPVFAAGLPAGCNTMEGLGKDFKKSGEAIKQTADKGKR